MNLKKILLLLLLVLNSEVSFANSQSDYEKALSAYSTKEYDEAYIHLKNSLQKDPGNLAAKILMGQIFLINGYLAAAEVEFVEALQQGADINIIAEPLGNALLFQNKYLDIIDLDYTEKLVREKKVKWLLIKASACIQLSRFDCAEKSYRDSLAIDANNTQAFNGLASIAISLKNYKDAEFYINQAMDISLEDPTTWRLKGQIARIQGDLDAAIQYMQQSLKLKENDPLTLRKLADLYLESNDMDNARIFVNEIIEKTPYDPLAILLSSWLDSKSKSNPIDNERLDKLNAILSNLGPEELAAQPELLYISGLTAFFNGNTEQAARDFANYLGKKPNDMQAVILLSRTYMATQQQRKALVLLENYQSELIKNLDAALLLGELFIGANRSFKAQSLVDELELHYPNDPRIQLFKIKLMMIRGKKQQALTILEENLDKNLENAGFLFTYSILNLQGDSKENALIGADSLLKLDPEDANYLNLKAGILIRLNRIDEAQTLIEQALLINPSFFAAEFNLASIYSRKGNIQESNKRIENLLALSPKHPQVLTLKAHNLTVSKELEQAVEIYKNILLLNPNDEYAQNQLAKIFFQMGKYDTALFHVDRLLTEHFDNPEYLLQKAKILLQQKKDFELEDILGRISLIPDLSIDTLLQLSQLQRAINKLELAITSLSKAELLAPDNSYISLDKVKLLIETDQMEKASKTLNSMASEQKENANFWLVKALYANKLNSESNTVNYLKKALSADPKFHQPLIMLYEMDLRGSEEANFNQVATGLITGQPNNILAKNLLAQFHYVKQDFAQASLLYKELLDAKIHINKAEIFNKLAIMSLETDLIQSKDYIEQAFALNENDAKILNTFGRVLSLEGQYEEGLGFLRKAYARDSNNPEISFNISYSLVKLGRLDEAKKELSAIVDIQRPFYSRAKAKALLESIQ